MLRIYKYGVILAGLALLCSFQNINTANTNARVKSVFMYNFSRYIEWPSSYKKGEFVIGVVGESPLYKELVNMARTKKTGNQSFSIKKYASVEQIGKCHIVFVPYKKSSLVSSVAKKVKGSSALVIAEKAGLSAKGAGINFVVKDNRTKFEMNKKALEKRGLKISYKLETLAILVN